MIITYRKLRSVKMVKCKFLAPREYPFRWRYWQFLSCDAFLVLLSFRFFPFVLALWTYVSQSRSQLESLFNNKSRPIQMRLNDLVKMNNDNFKSLPGRLISLEEKVQNLRLRKMHGWLTNLNLVKPACIACNDISAARAKKFLAYLTRGENPNAIVVNIASWIIDESATAKTIFQCYCPVEN